MSAKIADKYVLDKARHEKIALAVNQLEEKHLQRMKDKTPNGRFKCRFPGCNKTFPSDGKWRYTHEQSHNPPVSTEEQPLLTEIHEGVIVDDVYNYQKALLEYGMVVLNFFMQSLREMELELSRVGNSYCCICIMMAKAVGNMLWKHCT